MRSYVSLGCPKSSICFSNHWDVHIIIHFIGKPFFPLFLCFLKCWAGATTLLLTKKIFFLARTGGPFYDSCSVCQWQGHPHGVFLDKFFFSFKMSWSQETRRLPNSINFEANSDNFDLANCNQERSWNMADIWYSEDIYHRTLQICTLQTMRYIIDTTSIE